MNNIIKMILVLTGISLGSGLILGGVNNLTEEQIVVQTLKNKKLPAVQSIFPDADNDILADRALLELADGTTTLLFVAKKGGAPYGVALSGKGKGYGGDIETMIGIDFKTGDLAGIGIVSLSETPGVGSRVTEEPFQKQFRGMSINSTFKTKKDGGAVDAISGATISSRAVSAGIAEAVAFYQANEAAIKEKLGAK